MIDLGNKNTEKLLALFDVRGTSHIGEVIAAYQRARAAFDTFAGLDAPDLPPFKHHALQVQLYRWNIQNFDRYEPMLFAAGISEEAGELADAKAQLDGHSVRDAVGDIMVYSCQLATSRRLAYAETTACSASLFALRGHWRPSDSRILTAAVGLVSHVTLKSEQRIRGLDDPELARFGTFLGLSFLHHALVEVTGGGTWVTFERIAEEVMARNWRSDAAAGGVA